MCSTGAENLVADALSRSLCAVLPDEGGKLDLKQLAAAQATCPDSQEWRARPGMQVLHVEGTELLCDDLTGSLRPVVPATWRKAVFSSVHGLVHAGTRATKRMISSRYLWRGCIAAEVTVWCKDCQHCARGKVSRQEQAPVEPIPIPQTAYSHVHMDIVGPLPSSKEGHVHLLTMINRTTRWPEVTPLKSIAAEVIADTFVAMWVPRFGVPSIVITDCGTQFTGGIWI